MKPAPMNRCYLNKIVTAIADETKKNVPNLKSRTRVSEMLGVIVFFKQPGIKRRCR